MDVSVILVSYNTKDLTLDCIKSVYEKTSGLDFDIYLVDNNSHDGTCDAVEQQYPDVKVIRNQDNKGFGAANNIAIRLSDAKYVFCLNTDTLLINNAIKVLYDYMENNKNVGACGGQLYDKEMNVTCSVGNFPSILRIFFQFGGLKYLFPNYWKEKISPAKSLTSNTCTPVDYICGADIFFRKSVLDTIGLFDENIFMYGEESDICLRIKKFGSEVMFIPNSEIIHLCGKSSVNINKQKICLKSLLYWYKKNLGLLPFYLLKTTLIFNYIFRYIFSFKNEHKELIAYISRI